MKPKRKSDTGLLRPYRPLPDDFRERYAEMGWDGLEEHYRTNWRVIRRWVQEYGKDALDEARAVFLAKRWPNGPSGPRAKRYVLGRTLTAVKVRNPKCEDGA